MDLQDRPSPRRLFWIAGALSAISLPASTAGAQNTGAQPASALAGPAVTLSIDPATSASIVTTPDSGPTPRALGSLLDGAVTGATIESSTSDAPGEGLEMKLRGVTSLVGADEPLYVVDGVFAIDQPTVADIGMTQVVQGNGMNRISDIAPSDIASIVVLKGAAATAIYGAKAAAGAVIITTRRGTRTRAVHWELDGEAGHAALANELPIRQFPTLQSAQAWYIRDVTHDTTAAAIAKDQAFIQGIYAGPQNYQSELFGNPQLSDLTRVSVDGTVAATQYYLSALSTYTNGVALHTGDLAQSLRGNVTQHLGSAVGVTANISYMDDETHQGGFADGIGQNPYQVLSYTPGFVALAHPSASGIWPINPFGPSNPFADLVLGQAPALTTRFSAGGTVQATPWRVAHQSVQLALSGGIDHANFHDPADAPSSLESGASPTLLGSSLTHTGRITYVNYGATLTDHYGGRAIDATTTLAYQTDAQTSGDTLLITYTLSPGLPFRTAQSGYYVRTSAQQHAYAVQEQILALASRLSLTAGVTAMSSTLNGNPGEFFPYPHYAASYHIALPVSWVDEIKLRAASGEAGSVPPYGATGTLATKPETERETELGFDAPFLHARLQLSATAYTKHVSDLVLESQVSDVFLNGGAATNSGAELELQTMPVELRNGFTWTATTTFSRNYSVVDALAIAPFSMSDAFEGLEGVDRYVAVGRSLTEIVAPGETGADGLPRQVGDVMPGWQMSIGDALSFRRVRLFALADWSRGGTAIDFENFFLDFGGSLSGDSALTAQRVARYESGGLPYVESASYFTLRQVGVSYDLPDGLLHHVGVGRITSVRLSLTGYDLWSAFSYKGLDPQADDFGVPQAGVGFEPVPYPPARSYYLGLHLEL